MTSAEHRDRHDRRRRPGRLRHAAAGAPCCARRSGCSAGLLLLVVLLPSSRAGDPGASRADAVDTDAISQGPSGAHWVGTDNLGRDILSRVLVATRLSVVLALRPR